MQGRPFHIAHTSPATPPSEFGRGPGRHRRLGIQAGLAFVARAAGDGPIEFDRDGAGRVFGPGRGGPSRDGGPVATFAMGFRFRATLKIRRK